MEHFSGKSTLPLRDSSFKLAVEKEGLPASLSLASFEEVMGCLFLPQLHFADPKFLHCVEKKTEKLRKKGELTRKQLWLGSYYRQEIESGYTPDLFFRWIDEEIGWGVFAARPFRKGEFIGEYGGVLRKKRRIDRRNSYCFQYAVAEEHPLPYNIDAREQGGVARWINHSFRPNLLTMLATFDSVSHILLLAGEAIPRGAQLLYDYGADYWASRKGLRGILP
ncbi:MAG: SET domain-containing protein [Verrucomicrobiota bacterium]|nr:SET domain-containing protein [Verrucomicrobiota bacterium]